MTYLLDTHCIVWLLTKRESSLPGTVVDDIRYYANNYAVSEMSLVEIVQLQQKGSIGMAPSPKELREKLEYLNIGVLPVSGRVIDTFYELPMPPQSDGKHSDPFDRVIISTAICNRRRLVSHDRRFVWYANHYRLDLLYF